jgi:hypothetical protein
MVYSRHNTLPHINYKNFVEQKFFNRDKFYIKIYELKTWKCNMITRNRKMRHREQREFERVGSVYSAEW